MIPYTPPKAATSIPLIDLQGSYSPSLGDRKAVAWEIHKACRDTGFFYVKNSSVTPKSMAAHLDLARQFFALPLEEKRKVDVSLSSCTRGWEGMAAQVLDEGSPPDLKEGFLVGADLDADHPFVKQDVPNTGRNQWPAQPEGFRTHFNSYLDETLVLGKHLMSLLALSLELPENYFAPGLDEPLYTSRLLHYPPHPIDAAANQLGAGAHTDWGTLTMLLQDDIGGLEVQNADGDWIKAPYIPDTLIINLGEMVPVLTNGLYHSNMHRVLNNHSGRDRYSAPTFYDPHYFYEVKCVPTCLPESGIPKFPATTVGAHIAAMYRKTYGLAA